MPSADRTPRPSGRSRTARPSPTPPDPVVATAVPGAVEAAVLHDLAGLAVDVDDCALGQVALTLARALDRGAGLATAAVARELRATLAALTPTEEPDGPDALDDLITRLSAPMVDGA